MSVCFLWSVPECVCVCDCRGGIWFPALGGWIYVNESGGSDWLVTHMHKEKSCTCAGGSLRPTVALLHSSDSCESHQLAAATPPHDEGALQPGSTSSYFPSSAAAAAAAGTPSGTRGWMLPGSGWAVLGLHVHRLFWLCVSVCWLLVDRWGVPEAGHGDDGGVGLVSGPAGDNPDLPLCQRHGLQQGKRGRIFVFYLYDFILFHH